MGFFSDTYDSLFGSGVSSVNSEKARRARTFQLQNQACAAVRKCLDTNGVAYDDQVRTVVLSLVNYGDLTDPVNRNQLVSRCAYFFSETPAMKKRSEAIARKRRDIASINRLRGDLVKMLEPHPLSPDAQ